MKREHFIPLKRYRPITEVLRTVTNSKEVKAYEYGHIYTVNAPKRRS